MMDQTMHAHVHYHSEHMMPPNSSNHYGNPAVLPPSDQKGSDKPARRRSHRPRGCRGGSNRRKNHNGDLKNQKSLNKPSKKGMAPRKQPFFKHTKSNFNKVERNPRYGGGKNYQAPLIVNATPSSSNVFSGPNVFYGPGSYDPSSWSNLEYNSSAITSGSNQEFNNSSSSEFTSADFSSTSSSSNIQRSFSDSSSEEGIPMPTLQSFQPEKNNQYSNGLILPPLPSAVFQNTDQVPEHRGPNPYALQPATHHNIIYHHQEPLQHSQYAPGFFEGRNENPGSEPNAFEACRAPTDHQYKSERLAKQRQSVVGGSLFCTSPRSFLMGKAKTTVGSE